MQTNVEINKDENVIKIDIRHILNWILNWKENHWRIAKILYVVLCYGVYNYILYAYTKGVADFWNLPMVYTKINKEGALSELILFGVEAIIACFIFKAIFDTFLYIKTKKNGIKRILFWFLEGLSVMVLSVALIFVLLCKVATFTEVINEISSMPGSYLAMALVNAVAISGFSLAIGSFFMPIQSLGNKTEEVFTKVSHWIVPISTALILIGVFFFYQSLHDFAQNGESNKQVLDVAAIDGVEYVAACNYDDDLWVLKPYKEEGGTHKINKDVYVLHSLKGVPVERKTLQGGITVGNCLVDKEAF